jgi:hypothetical protein
LRHYADHYYFADTLIFIDYFRLRAIDAFHYATLRYSIIDAIAEVISLLFHIIDAGFH